MTQTPEAAALQAQLEPELDTYLQELRQLCAIECPTAAKAGVDEAGAWVHSWATRRGWQIERHTDTLVGDSLVITLRGGRPGGLRVLLAAHLDTVYPLGTAAARPLRIEGDVLLAPGSADNKSGLLSALYAMAALQELDMLAAFDSISLVCGGDEETDMRASGAVLRALAPHYNLALVLEAGRENGDIVSARKGGGHLVLEVYGVAAHAGVEPHKGASAILALAQQIVALHLLNGKCPGATLNVGVMQGGSVSNAVPDYARADIDVRVIAPDDVAVMDAAIRAIAAAPPVPGTHAELSGGWGAGPMARTAQIAALAAQAISCANELGFSLNDAATGGLSYANHLAAAGLPVLDGLGPVGGLDHSPREYILVSSIVPRTALLALLMLRLAQTAGQPAS